MENEFKSYNPCEGVCRGGDDGFCEGCKRTDEEIMEWDEYTEQQRNELLETLKVRKELSKI